MNKYYVVEGGEILKDCEAFRKSYIEQSDKLREYVNTHLENVASYSINFVGQLSFVKFKHGVTIPDGYTKPNKHGAVNPKGKKSPWKTIFDQAPRVHEGTDPILVEKYKIPYVIDWQVDDECYGFTRMDTGFYTTQICWYHQDEPLLLILPDVQGKLDELYKEYPNMTVKNSEIESWKLPEGLREILKEEWALMEAKFKQKRKLVDDES